MGSIRKHTQTEALFLDFRYQGHRCREYTALSDTSANRKKLQRVLVAIEDHIAEGTFNYRDFFPNSKNAAKFDPVAPTAEATRIAQAVGDMGVAGKPTPLFKEFANTWYDEKSIEWRTSHKKTIRDDIDKRLIPQFGERAVGSITKADILAFRADLAKVQARGKNQTLSNPRC